jgi:PKD repeat protein
MTPFLIRLARAFAASLFILVFAGAAVVAAADIGHKDFGTGGGSAVTGSKPESKVWFNDGFWWASMQPTSSSGFFIYKLDPSTDTWASTGTSLDTRNGSRADTLWDGSKLYVASQVFSVDGGTTGSGSSFAAFLYRFSYSASTQTYSLDGGFPATIRSGLRTETLVIAKDSTGTLWATWTQKGSPTTTNLVKVNHTIGTNDANWSAPVTLPVGSQPVNVKSTNDDISSVIAFNGRIGVLWSNQADQKDYFASRADSDNPDTATWTAETALSGSSQADDHVNLKADSAGQVYAVVKTSLSGSNPLIRLLRRTTGGTWSAFNVATAGESNTRPILELDDAAGVLHVFMTGPQPPATSGQSGGDIYEKTSPTSTISFPSGAGTVVIRDTGTGGARMNNVTSTKQNVSLTSGMLVLAFNDTTKFYWHARVTPGGGGGPPVANFSANPTSGPPGQSVAFTDLSSNSPTGWDWDFGDGTLPHGTTQNPSHVYAAAGTYTVTLIASNTSGPSAPVSRTNYISITTGGGGGTPITLTPDADAQVKVGSTTNLGADVQLRTREENPVASSTYRSFLRFNVAGLTGSVNTVTLRLWVNTASANTQTVFNTTSNPAWPEATTNGTNAPAIGSTAYGSSTASPAGAYKDIPLLPSSIPGNVPVTFAVTSSGTTSAYFSSKEGAHPPQLVITQTASGPHADFVATTPTSGGVNLNVTFSGAASTGTGLTYDWTFGDTTTGTGVNPTHQYTAPGTYTVALKVTDASSATDTMTKVGYVVIDSVPSAAFTSDKTSGNAPLLVNFDASTSTGTNLVYTWNFGDPGSGSANTSNLQKPSHTFATANTYTVSLTVSNAAGSSGPVTQSITVNSGTPTTITVPVAGDAHVNSANVAVNYGNLTPIRTREDSTGANTYRPYFQFNVPAFSGSVSSVKLRLYVTTASTAMTQSVYLVGNGWTETGITWTNAPVLPASSIGSGVAGTANAYVEFTLTTPIVPNTTYSFALKSSGSTSVYFNSDDSATNKPELVIVAGP